MEKTGRTVSYSKRFKNGRSISGSTAVICFAAVLLSAFLCCGCQNGPDVRNGEETEATVTAAEEKEKAETEITAGADLPGAAESSDPDAENGTEETAVGAEEQEIRLSFLGAGDNIIYEGNINDARRCAAEGEEYDFAHVYDPIADRIGNADLAFINQETLMCGEGFDLSFYPCFNSPQEVGDTLVGLGFDVVNIANNHMLDRGAPGLGATIEYWKSQPVLMLGGCESYQDYQTVRVWHGDGIDVAFLSYTYGTNGNVLPASSSLWVPYLFEADIPGDVAKARELADLVFISVHWGIENSFVPSDEQRSYAQIMADSGADVIIGHHPHVIQPIEWIEGKNGNRTLCIYSLGNLMAMMAEDYNLVGGLVSFDMVKPASGNAYVENVSFLPTLFNYPSTFRGLQVMPLSGCSEQIASSLGLSYYGNSTTKDRLFGFVSSTIGGEFLSEDFLAAAAGPEE